jgi:hypothetical protein
MSLAFIKRQIQQAGLREWQHTWRACTTGSAYLSIARRQPLWNPTWRTTKLINTNRQTTASTIHQLRLGHGYFKSYLIRLPQYDSTKCQCSEALQNVRHLLLGCPLLKESRRSAGITRETTLNSLLFTPRGAITGVLQSDGRSKSLGRTGKELLSKLCSIHNAY